MAESAGGKGTAHDAKVVTGPNSPDRPAMVPADYIWDPMMGPIEDHTGKPSGAWREPDKEKP